MLVAEKLLLMTELAECTFHRFTYWNDSFVAGSVQLHGDEVTRKPS